MTTTRTLQIAPFVRSAQKEMPILEKEGWVMERLSSSFHGRGFWQVFATDFEVKLDEYGNATERSQKELYEFLLANQEPTYTEVDAWFSENEGSLFFTSLEEAEKFRASCQYGVRHDCQNPFFNTKIMVEVQSPLHAFFKGRVPACFWDGWDNLDDGVRKIFRNI